MPLRITVLALAAVCAFATARAQTSQPLPACPSGEAHTFDFLVGRFSGSVYEVSGQDSTSAGVRAEVLAEKVLSGCALLERWHFMQGDSTEDDVVVLRAFDAVSGQWSYDLANRHLDHVTWVGERDGGGWYFRHDFVNGVRRVAVRIRWVPTEDGYSEQVSRSSDSGKTWVNTRHINFRRS